MSNIKRNFYEILNALPTASCEELKTNYKQLILQCHPDKLLQQQQQQHEQFEMNIKNLKIQDDPNNLEFLAITEAWNCLKDPLKRRQYDAEQFENKYINTHYITYAHITLNDMTKLPNTGDYFQDDDNEEEEEEEESKEHENTKTSKYIYTYDCRCGGQYIVDESAEQYCRSGSNNNKSNSDEDNNGGGVDDDADQKNIQNNKNSPITNKKNNGGGDGDGDEGVVFTQDNGAKAPSAAVEKEEDDNDDDDDSDLIVECSDCSLVIILNG